jgi:hypothetical protein
LNVWNAGCFVFAFPMVDLTTSVAIIDLFAARTTPVNSTGEGFLAGSAHFV